MQISFGSLPYQMATLRFGQNDGPKPSEGDNAASDLSLPVEKMNLYKFLASKPDRYWTGEEGMSIRQAMQARYPTPNVALVRADGWTICSTSYNYDSMHALGDDQWVKKIVITH